MVVVDSSVGGTDVVVVDSSTTVVVVVVGSSASWASAADGLISPPGTYAMIIDSDNKTARNRRDALLLLTAEKNPPVDVEPVM